MSALHPRIGHGFDLHRLEPDLSLWIAGLQFEHTHGCAAHSDGDVVLHALTDALLGSLGMDDIGTLFPDNDPKWRGADSSIFIKEAMSRVTQAGYCIGNVDITVICQRPKLGPRRAEMKTKLAELLSCDVTQVNIKGKTHEKVDSIGEGRAIACHVVAILFPANDTN